MTHLPLDDNNAPMPVLRFANAGAQKITVTAAATKNANAFADTTKVISIYSTTAVYIKQGASDVAATVDDHYIPAGIWLDIGIGDTDNSDRASYLSALRVSADGILYISERQ